MILTGDKEEVVTAGPADMGGLSHWRVWQLLDSAFPTGGFAHSNGLEAAWQQGWIASGKDVHDFAMESLGQAVWSAAPFINAIFAGECPATVEIQMDAMLVNHVAHRASRLQGQALAATAAKVFGGTALEALRRDIVEKRRIGHHAIVFGEVMRILNISQETSLRLFLFILLRGVLSAAVRLGAVGPLEAQAIQAGFDAPLESLVRTACALSIQDAAQRSPALELWQMAQDRLYSRLFQS